MTVYRVAGLQTELSERVRRWRRTWLTLRTPGSGHRTAAIGFRHGSVGYHAGHVTAAVTTTVVDTPAVQQMSVAKSHSGILEIEECIR